MGRGARPWWVALAISLLLHGGVLGGLGWRLPQWSRPAETAPLEVQLVSAPQSIPGVAPSPPRPVRPAPKPAAHRPPARLKTPEPLPPAEAAVEAAASAVPADADAMASQAATGAASAEPAPVTAARPPPAEASLPPLNSLPQRLDLHYRLRYGLASGEQTLLWVREGERYTLTSVAAATGLTRVFYGGRFVQTSRGRITPRGLQPEEFWDQRGDKHSSARFDPAQGLVTLLPETGGPRHFAYSGEVQDALSLFFQLALTAPPPDGRLSYTVFNGKKLRDYAYEVRGEETLDTALGPLRTLHLARVADNDDGRFEAWLALDRYYLPVRVIRSDDVGNTMELRVQSIAP